MGFAVLQGDCRDLLKEMEDNAVHSIVCDPPYELAFMNRHWDRTGIAYDPEVWYEALRVLKPGGHLLAFGGTRTFHRVATAVEDEGFEIRDALCWLYGKGFPKSLDISKALDKRAGSYVPGKVLDTSRGVKGPLGFNMKQKTAANPQSQDAVDWEGWGTALKPGWEPIIMARKPLEGTVAENVLLHGVGGLNIGGTRLGYQGAMDKAAAVPQGRATSKVGALAGGMQNDEVRTDFQPQQIGRWPSNVILQHDEDCVQCGTHKVASTKAHPVHSRKDQSHTGYGSVTKKSGEVVNFGDENGEEEIERWACVPGCPLRLMDSQVGMRRAGGQPKSRKSAKFKTTFGEFQGQQETWPGQGYSVGSATRFFYCTKASRKERDAGLEDLDLQIYGQSNQALARTARGEQADNFDGARDIGLNRLKEVKNPHPTVKPIEVMRWLTRMVTPVGGTVLDPFLGSGSTGIGAVLEGFDFLGFELEPAYARIAEKRIQYWAEGGRA